MIEQLSSDWFQWQIRGAVLAALVLIAAMPFHWRSPIWRHWVLVSGTIALLILPILMIVLPSWEIKLLTSDALLNPARSPVPAVTDRNTWPFVVTIFSMVSLLFTVRLVFSYVKQVLDLRKSLTNERMPDAETLEIFNQCACELGMRNRLKKEKLLLKVIPENVAPFTIGVYRSKVVLPHISNEGDDADKRIVLIHELQHVKRRDWLWQQCTMLLVFMYPLNPLVWLIKSRTRVSAEESVDKLSLACDIPPTIYAEALLRQLRLCQRKDNSVAVNLSQRVDISERIASLIAEPYSWDRPRTFATSVVCLFMLCLALPVASLHVEQREPDLVFRPYELSVSRESNVKTSKVSNGERPLSVSLNKPLARPLYVQPPKGEPLNSIYTIDIETEVNVDAQGIEVQASRMMREDVVIPVEPSPLYLHKPDYPKRALENGREAIVEVIFDLDENGRTENSRINRTDGDGADRGLNQFEKAAVAAIRESRFEMEDPYNRPVINQSLTQVYVFKVVEGDRPPSLRVQAKRPP